ncbi:RNA polymerase sigma factor [Brevundimonas olei]|uniref:RNA polymerase sigma factor n=1 Tax=Brevundimonas olei TaxID=657642 RepID=UPI0031DAA6C3
MKHARIDYVALTTPDLVGRAQGGDPEAFRAIMQRANQRLFRVARAVLHDESEAEDALQDAYVRAFLGIGRFRGEADIVTWLTRIVLNEARSRLRRRRPFAALEAVETAQTTTGEIILFPGAAFDPGPESDAARSQIRSLIEQAVDDLPPAFRAVFIMRDIEGCSIEETAAGLGLKPETVKTRLHRARRLLRQALDERVSACLIGAFPFLGARCRRMSDRVLARLARVQPAKPETGTLSGG